MTEELMETHGSEPTVRNQPRPSACVCQVCSLVDKSPNNWIRTFPMLLADFLEPVPYAGLPCPVFLQREKLSPTYT